MSKEFCELLKCPYREEGELKLIDGKYYCMYLGRSSTCIHIAADGTIWGQYNHGQFKQGELIILSALLKSKMK
jgi:hypothetical protein